MQKCLVNADNEIGIDEAGRGPLIGRVYAGAVIWGESTDNNKLIMDSKKLTPKKRKIALEWIYKNVKAWGVGWADHNEIDNINILEATKLAMERAIDDLKNKYNYDKTKILLLIDGTGWEKKFSNYNIKSIIKGDSTYLSIAAASIIAKEHHDAHINDLCLEYTDLNIKYDLINNKGYGTKKHIEGLKIHGISNFHRTTFKPCCIIEDIYP
jgi:ribonuclease HII